MSLNSNIRETIQMFRDTLPPELNTMIEAGAGEISALDIVEKALKVGDKAPEFELLAHDGEPRKLTDYLQDGPLVLTFYRGIWCPYCNLQLAAYNERIEEIKAAGANLVAVTPEQSDAKQVFLDSDAPKEAKDTMFENPSFDVLFDESSKLGEAFGLTFKLPEAHAKFFELINLDVERANGDGSLTFPDPATYIIGTDGLIKWAFVPNNYRKRAEPEEIIQQLKTL